MKPNRVIYAALIGNLLVAVTKGFAAAITGSSAMLSEAIHSVVDTGNEVLLLYGIHRSKVPAHSEHPLGHGRELYFWSFVVALLIFALGAGVSIYEGIAHIRHPEPITNPLVNYVVLALAFVFEGWTWLIALREFKAVQGSRGFYETFHRSKDPPSFMILFEDSAALAGITVAAAGTFAATSLGYPVADGIASVGIGLVLAATSVLLARESKSLLIGERANPELTEGILRIAKQASTAGEVSVAMTVQLAPDQIVVALTFKWPDDLRVSEIVEQVRKIEREVQAAYPEIVDLFIKPRA
jgi:cation diffusion facilitator family transporter